MLATIVLHSLWEIRSVGLPNLDCEGVFDKENPPSVDEDGEEVDDDGDEMMRLDTEINRDTSLKRLGNSKHKPFNHAPTPNQH